MKVAPNATATRAATSPPNWARSDPAPVLWVEVAEAAALVSLALAEVAADECLAEGDEGKQEEAVRP